MFPTIKCAVCGESVEAGEECESELHAEIERNEDARDREYDRLEDSER